MSLHERVVVATARSANLPRAHPQYRITVDDVGYIPGALRLAMGWQIPL